MARELILKLGKKITDRVDVKLGMTQLDETSPEYYGLASVVTDEMAELALAMKVRVPTTPAEIGKKVGKDPVYVEQLFDQMSMIGLLEYNWENADHHKQWTLPIFVPGSAELMNMNLQQVEEHPEIAQFFERMAFLPLTKITCMVPPGGAGVGMHVIPVEKAIPATNESVDVEHISHWLKKYEDHLGVGYCSCRNAMRLQGQGCGELQDEMCIAVGQFCDYCLETGKGRKITYEEAMEILQRAEDNGYVHQITNIDGEDKIFAICNCALGSCFALRTSQLFNTPNMSASAYRAHVDAEKCVACGKCAEVCPAGAAKLGQKLCTKTGPVVYPKQPLPDDNHWGEHMWSPNYKDDNQKQCHESGTAPCKTACPAHIAVQGYINLAAQGRYLDALKLIKQDNPFPAVCGSICNRRCEDACTRGNVDRAVAIDEIKKFVAEQELQADKRYIPKVITHRGIADPYPEKIAIIGAGPAGLSCAYYLANMGYENVTVFDKNEVPGGMLTLGIPSFRLEKDVVNAEIEVLKEMGVHFQCGVEIGKDITIDQLREQGYKGFYLAIGAQKSAPIGIPGEELSGVYGGVDFLRKVNLGKKPRIGKKCAVIGGGNVAMDVCRTAIRLGAQDTYVIYRRSQAEMPADAEEVAEAMEEGVQFRFLSAPAEILGENGKVKAIKVEIMELGEPDEKGRRKPVGTGKFETIEVTSVIGAIGQRVDLGHIAPEAMAFNRNGTVQVDGVTYQTAQPDVFAGGDVVTGPKFAIDAIAAGREGAVSLHRFVSAPAEILGENGKVKAIKVEIMELGEPDEKGRRKPVGTGKFETIEVTSVIGAIGQRVDLGHIAPEAMAFNRNGTVQVDGVTYQTAQPDVFAGGDVVTGPKFAIDAIAAGREGAVSLHRFVHDGQSLTLARDPREFYELDKNNAVLPIDCFDAPARQTVAHDASKAKTFSNDRITFTEAQVKAEASRCLGCGVSVVDQNKCIGCGLCTTRCEFDAIHLQRDMPEASRMYRTEDKMKAILPHMVKRAAKITIKDIKEKCAK